MCKRSALPRIALILLATFVFVSTGVGQDVRINEISPEGDWIELYNQSGSEVDVSSLWLCSKFVYRRIDNGDGAGPDISVISGSLAIPSGEYLVLSWDIDAVGADIGLYNSNSFASAAAMEDFMQYNFTGAGGRENVAVTKGIWTAGTSAPAVLPGKTLSYFGPGTGAGAWDISESTRGADNASLPVELAEFSGQLVYDAVELSWSTRSEINNLGFEVQVMAPTTPSFETVGFVPAGSEGSGIQNYAYTVDGLVAGRYYFRLRQLDIGGTIKYSSLVEISVPVAGTHEISNAYPNPFNDRARFNLAVSKDQNVEIEVYDISGRQVATVFTGMVSADNTRQFHISGTSLPSGTYFYRVTGENFSTTKSVVRVSF